MNARILRAFRCPRSRAERRRRGQERRAERFLVRRGFITRNGVRARPACHRPFSEWATIRSDVQASSPRAVSGHTPIDPAMIPVPAEAHCRRFVEAVFRRLQQRRCQAIALTPQRIFGERSASL
jgi:hypothetical protein